MQVLFQIFSTREISLFIWATLALMVMLFNASIREELFIIFKLLFGKKIGSVILLHACYTFCILLVLYKIEMWNSSFIKDTVFWFVFVGVILSVQIDKAKGNNFFKETVKESFKWSIMVEFLVNLYTFSLVTEIILVPILVLSSALITFSESVPKYEQVNKLLNKLVILISLLLIAIAVYKIFKDYQTVLSLNTAFSFLLPPILMVLHIPFLYLLALYMNYEELFIDIKYFTQDEDSKKRMKSSIFLIVNLNLNRLMMIRKKINKFDVYHSSDIKVYLRKLISAD
ncbi:MAG: hypothetical protein V4538_03265 [Bacteroidota bacterium]